MSKIMKIASTVVACGFLAGAMTVAFAVGANTSLPFRDNFEVYTNGTPLINGTNGWYGSDPSIVVQTNIFRPTGDVASSNAAVIPFNCTLSNLFTGIPSSYTNVWIQMDIRPTLHQADIIPVVDTNAAAMFYVNSNGNFVVHNGVASPDITNSTKWVTLTNFNFGVGTNGPSWARINVKEDFSNTNWTLYANGILVTNNIGFINPGLTNFGGFDVYSPGDQSYIDNVLVSTTNKTVLTVTGSFLTVASRQYNATVDATITNQSLVLVGTNGDEGLTLHAVATYADKNVGIGKTVSLQGSWLSGVNADNYMLCLTNATTPTTTADITPSLVTLTVIGMVGNNKTYDRLFTASASGIPVISGMLFGDTVTAGGTPTYKFASSNVATAISISTVGFTIGGPDGGNYSVITQPTLSANITQAPLTVTGLTGSNKVYDRTFTATVTGTAAPSGVISPDVVTVGGTPTFKFASSNYSATAINITTNVGGFSLVGADAGNYSLTQPTLSANINKAGLTASLVSTIRKPYNGNDVATLGTTNFALVGLVGIETCTVTKTTGTYATTNAATGISVSTTLASTDFNGTSGFATNNYTLPTSAAGSVGVITKATLTVATSPTASTITFGQTLASSFLTGGSVINAASQTVDGTFAFTTPTTAPAVGTANQSVTFTPTDAGNYEPVVFDVSVTVITSGPSGTILIL